MSKSTRIELSQTNIQQENNTRQGTNKIGKPIRKNTTKYNNIQTRKWIDRFLSPQSFFLIFALLTGLAAIFTMPVGGGLDEPQHLARIEQLASGQITPVFTGYADGYPTNTEAEKRNASLYGGQGDSAMFKLARQGLINFQTGEHRYSFPLWNDPESSANKQFGSEGTETIVFSNTAVNFPVVYLPYLLGFILGRAIDLPIFWLVMIMRLIGYAVYVIGVFWCIRTIPIGKWPFSVIATLPATISSITSISADTVTVTLSFMMITLFFCMLYSEQARRSWWILLGITSILLPVAKIAYVPLLGFLIALPIANKKYRQRNLLIRLGLFFTGGMLMFICWYGIISGINTGAMWKPGINPGEQMSSILHEPLHYLKIFIFSVPFIDPLQATTMGVQGGYSYAYFTGSGWFGIVLLCIAMTLHEHSEMPLPKLSRHNTFLVSLTCALIFIICTVLIFLALYLTFTEIGGENILGMQNRYFIPIAPLILIPISILSRCSKGTLSSSVDIGPRGQAPLASPPQKCICSLALRGGIYIFSFANFLAFAIVIMHSTL